MTDFRALLLALTEKGVQFLLVGGVAAMAHGSSRLTQDVDIVYARDAENLQRMCEALAPYSPYLRGAPAGLPFKLDQRTLARGLNFTLTTAIGDLDLLGEIVGGGGYADLVPHTVELKVFGTSCRCLDLRTLIAVKRAAGRPKDFEAIAELELLLEEQNG